MASLTEVDHALHDVVRRLHAVDEQARRRGGLDRTVSCRVTDLGVVYWGRFCDGEMSGVTTGTTASAQVRLTVGSDDLVALTQGRLALPVAWASGRLRVDASVLDLLRLRTLL